MADVAGFVGAIYPVKPLKEIAIAGETADAMVSLPQTRATLMAFLEVNSLAKIWNYVRSFIWRHRIGVGCEGASPVGPGEGEN
ncbi:hypothetical protein BG003_005538 [Podila horticola]|nr:hypothetical protein BG003_005538 [Podila horticola]